MYINEKMMHERIYIKDFKQKYEFFYINDDNLFSSKI